MGVLDRVRSLTRRSGRVGLEIGRQVAAVQVAGRPPEIVAAGHSAHAGYSGQELGDWLKRWFETIEVTGRSARLVVADGDVHHFLVTMPEMSDRERDLAAGAELRKRAPVPAEQLAYAHQAVGSVQEHGVRKQRVLISAVDRSTLRNVLAAAEAAGLRVESVSTVPSVLAGLAQRLPPVSGGQAIAYLSGGRSYLLLLQRGGLELVRDFVLRSPERDADPEQAADVIAAELQRSFLYFTQRAHGAGVRRLLLAGPMSGLQQLAARLRQRLGIAVEPFDASAVARVSADIDLLDEPALATALAAAAAPQRPANLVSARQVAEEQVRRFLSVGQIAAAGLLALLLGWGVYSMLDASIRSRSLARTEERLTQRRQELAQARAVVQARLDHTARQALLQQRLLESTLMGVMLQRVGLNVPDEVVLEKITWQRADGPQGQTYWDVRLDGLVLGRTRSESQALFNRFYGALRHDPIVHDVHLVEPLVIGVEEARVPPPLTASVREYLSGGAGAAAARAQAARPEEPPRVRTTLDDLPPFGPTETSVGFKLAVQLRAIQSGGTR